MTNKMEKRSLQDCAEELDVQVMRGWDGEVGSFYLGWPDELAAGIYGDAVSPYFSSEELLLKWTKEHWTELYKKWVEPYL